MSEETGKITKETENGLNVNEEEKLKKEKVKGNKNSENSNQADKVSKADSNIKRECGVEEDTERSDDQEGCITDVPNEENEKDSNKSADKIMHEQPEDMICSGCRGTVENIKKCNICLKYKVKSYFCGDECYKKSYNDHKILHIIFDEVIKKSPNNDGGDKVIQELNLPETITKDTVFHILKEKLKPENYDPYNRLYWFYDEHLKKFMDFEFTGKIRPWPITKMRVVPNHIEKPDYALTSVPASELAIKNKRDIYVNTEEDIKKIRAVSILGRKVLDYAHTLVKPGVTTEEIDKKVYEYIINNNAYPSTLNYFKFPKSCCTSVNEIVCHGIPDTRPLEKGDIINIDISVFSNGVHSDLNETYFVGELDEISQEAKDLVETCYFALMEAIKTCKPGMLYKNIGNVITSFVSKKKYSVVRTYSGHGVGKCFHSNPTIPHYKKNKAVGIMQPGHIFTIEPMINQGTYADILWPDGWTSVTADGKLSAQFEHTLLVTKTGVEVLTKRFPNSPSLGFDTKDHLYYG